MKYVLVLLFACGRGCGSPAEVIITNFKPGTMEAWGLGYDDVAARNPGVIYAAGSTYGTTGPDAPREGADLAAQAAGGLISTTGRLGGEPTPVGATVADHTASQNLLSGVLAALLARHRTGRGQRIDLANAGQSRGGLGVAERERVGGAVEHGPLLVGPHLVEGGLVELADRL